MQISVDVLDPGVADQVRRLGPAGEQAMADLVLRGGLELGRIMKRLVPKAHSTTADSITTERVAPHETVTGPRTQYARYIEQGAGPGGFPPEQELLEWLRVKGIEPRDPDMDLDDLAYIVARSIHARGTPAQPFLPPTLVIGQARLRELARDALGHLQAGFGA